MADRKKLKREAQYKSLAEDGRDYFPGCTMTLWPNGEGGVIWIGNGRHGVSIKAGTGPRGLGVTVRRFVGGAPLTVRADHIKDGSMAPAVDADEVTITQYNPDQKSQAFKIWYGLDGSAVDLDDEAIKLAYKAGREAAQANKPLSECPLGGHDKLAFQRGYYAQLAGLHDKE